MSYADLGGTENACHVETNPATCGLDIAHPLDYPDKQAVTDYVKGDRDDFSNFVKMLSPSDFPYGHTLHPHTYWSGTRESGTASVVFEVYGDSDAHPVAGFDALNYDNGTHTPITFGTLFKPGSDPVAVLDPIVQREMDKKWDHDCIPTPRPKSMARNGSRYHARKRRRS